MEPEERIRELERALDAARRELSLAREEASKATFFKKLVESSTDMVSVIGADGKASYVSPAHERVTGHSLAEIVSGTALDTIHPDDRASIAAKMEEILAAPADRVLRAELRRHHKDGRWIHVETSARNMTDDPDVRGILVNGREIEDFVRMRQELRDTEARYEVAMLASRETIWEEDLASGAVSFSGGMGEQLGYPAAAFARTKAQLRALVHDDDRAVLERAEQRHLATGSLYDVEVRVRASTGEYRWYRIVGHVLCDEQGRKARLIGHAADVHDRKVAEIALHDSERMFRALFEDTSIAVTLRDVRSQKFIDCNSAALRLYGFASREELYDTTPDQLTEVTQPDGQRSVDVLRAYVQRAMRDGAARMEWVARRRTGEAFQAEVQTTVITLEGGARVMQTLIDDVTERTRVARALERRARRDEMVSRVSRLFVESGADVAIPFALGELGVLLGAGRVRMRQFVDGGAAVATLEEWCADGVVALPTVREDARTPRLVYVAERLAREGFVAIGDVLALPDAARATVLHGAHRASRAVLVVPVSSRGSLVGWIVVEHMSARAWSDDDVATASLIAQITAMGRARAEAEARTRASEERYRTLVERSGDAILLMDLEGNVSYASPAAREVLGYAPEELSASPGLALHILQPEAREELAEWQRARATGSDPPKTPHAWAWRRQNGSIVDTESTLASIRDAAGSVVGLQIIARDVTDRRRAEEGARRRAAHDELASDVSRRFLNDEPDAATEATLERLAVTFDAETVSLFTIDESPVLRCTLRFRARAGDGAGVGLERYPVSSAEVVPADGTSPDAESQLAALETDPTGRILHARVGYGGRVFGLLRVVGREGRRWSEDDAATLRMVGELIAVGRVRHAAEIALAKGTRDAIAASATKSAFLANMSHELRTPLNGVIGMVDLLATTRLDARQRRFAEIARASADLLLSIISDILDFSKIEAGKLEIEDVEVGLGEIVEEVATVLAPGAEAKGLELSCATDPSLASPCMGDPSRLRQVLVNLVSNAVKFTRTGEIAIHATRTASPDGAPRARITVRDTGVGIPLDSQKKLFQPFTQVDASTTREHGGTGLGLAICRELVERMGGTIGLESAPGQGSTFWFELAFREAPRPGAGDASRARDPYLAEVRVLAVDDHATNRELLRAQLGAAGMTCDVAAGGAEALEVLAAAARRAPYALAVIDHQMPEMDGLTLARRIKADAQLAATRVVMLTSVGSPLGEDDQRAAGIVATCTKPIRRAPLLRVLRAALDARAPVPADATPLPAAERGARVLLVEDSPINAEVAGEILRSAGYVFDLAEDGLAAVEAASARAYDLVLMDCQLPEIDGFEATRRIRALERDGALPRGASPAPLPIVALTASATKEDLARCLAAGMDAHVAKPLDARRLLALIASRLAQAPRETGEAHATPATPATPVTDARAGAPVADLSRALERLGGDHALLQRIAAQFTEHAAATRASLRAAVGRHDGPAVAFAGHRLRGQAQSFDGLALVRATTSLEEAAAGAHWTGAGAALERVEAELDLLIEALGAPTRPA